MTFRRTPQNGTGAKLGVGASCRTGVPTLRTRHLHQRCQASSQSAETQGFGPVIQRVGLRAGVDDEHAAQLQILVCDLQRLGDAGSVRVLELEAIALAVDEDEQVEFGSALRVPEVRL